jgi:YVTN family beta-propeller protein
LVSILVIALSLDLGCLGQAKSRALPLRHVVDIPVDKATRRFDYASVDARRAFLFVADLAGGRVLVFDVRADRLVKAIDQVQGVHGVLAVPDLGRVYASATGVDEVVAIDEATLKIAARTAGGHYPDGIAWDPRERKIYVSDEHGATVAVIDAATSKLVRKIPVGGEVGNTQYDAASGLIYTNVQTKDDLVGIDPKTDAIVSHTALPGCQGNHGLLIDPKGRLAYVACEDNAKLVTYSLATKRVVAVQSIGPDPDVLALDPGLRRLYVAGEAGVVSAFDVSADRPAKIGEERVADNAHIVAVDPQTHRVFFPLRNVGGKPLLRVMEPK